MKTKWWAIVLMILCTLILSIGNIFWKIGADRLVFNFASIINNNSLILGFVFYGISGVMFIFALRGGQLTVIHPMISLSLIWAAVLAPLILPQDIMNFAKWAGITIMLGGVTLIGYGDWRINKKWQKAGQ